MDYVCGFMASRDGQLALVRKSKPEWQAGKLNGIGGKVEPGEWPHVAMVREWREETANSHDAWTQFATLRIDADGVVHFYSAQVERMPGLMLSNDIGEPIEIHSYASVFVRDDVIPNLNWLLPLAFEDQGHYALVVPLAA